MNKTLQIILYVALAVLMVSCGFRRELNERIDEFDDQNMTIGPATISQPVSEINIMWLEGNIHVVATDDSVVSFSETCDAPLDEAKTMRYSIDRSGKLNLLYCRKGKGQKIDISKDLTLRIPRTMLLDEINITGIDNDITIDSICCNELDIDGVEVQTTARLTQLPHDISISGVEMTLNLFAPADSRIHVDADGMVVKAENYLGEYGDLAECEIEAEGVNTKVIVRENK